MTAIKCTLVCINNLHRPIALPHGKEVSVGRSRKTRITDQWCSRKQVLLCADTEEMQVRVTQTGRNVTGVNGMALGKGESQTLRHDDRIELLLGRYVYKIEFDPSPFEKNNVDKDVTIIGEIIPRKRMRLNKSCVHTTLKTESEPPDNESFYRTMLKTESEPPDNGLCILSKLKTENNSPPGCGLILGRLSDDEFNILTTMKKENKSPPGCGLILNKLCDDEFGILTTMKTENNPPPSCSIIQTTESKRPEDEFSILTTLKTENNPPPGCSLIRTTESKRPDDEFGILTTMKTENNPPPSCGPILKTESKRLDDESCDHTTLTTESKWEHVDNDQLLIYTGKGVEGREKIAAYDLDGTIITTRSGLIFPRNIDDWKIAFSEVPGKLKQLWNEGYKIVIFSNQAGIARGLVKPEDFKSKVVKIISKMGIPIQAFVSTGKAIYRKPAPGMWNVLVDKKNDGIPIDMSKSFYCGDAAGRIQNWAAKKKKDFSCSDRLFALNLGLKFFTPEEHFLQQKPDQYKMPSFVPSSLKTDIPICEPKDAPLTSENQEVILFVGCPGSGKSFVTKTYLVPKGYKHINRDTLGSWQKCLSTMIAELDKGNSVVIDNTNPNKESRIRFIQAANNREVPVRCFVMKTSFDHCKHNNKFREFTDSDHEKITDMIMHSYKSKYEDPQLDEGLSSIVKINCVPIFSDPDLEKLYRMYLLEK